MNERIIKIKAVYIHHDLDTDDQAFPDAFDHVATDVLDHDVSATPVVSTDAPRSPRPKFLKSNQPVSPVASFKIHDLPGHSNNQLVAQVSKLDAGKLH
nr:hypothetical protein CFP56_69969 [Quercus suber]